MKSTTDRTVSSLIRMEAPSPRACLAFSSLRFMHSAAAWLRQVGSKVRVLSEPQVAVPKPTVCRGTVASDRARLGGNHAN
jgi:hypothetical protein